MSQPDRIKEIGEQASVAESTVRELAQKAFLSADLETRLLAASEQHIDTAIDESVAAADLGLSWEHIQKTSQYYQQLLRDQEISPEDFGGLMEQLNIQSRYAEQRAMAENQLLLKQQQDLVLRRSRRWLPAKVIGGAAYAVVNLYFLSAATGTGRELRDVEKELAKTSEHARVIQLDRASGNVSVASGFLTYEASKREKDKNIPEKFPNPDYAKKQLKDALKEMGDLGESDDILQIIFDSLPDIRGELKTYGQGTVTNETFKAQRDDLDQVRFQIKQAQEVIKSQNPEPWLKQQQAQDADFWAKAIAGLVATPGLLYGFKRWLNCLSY